MRRDPLHQVSAGGSGAGDRRPPVAGGGTAWLGVAARVAALLVGATLALLPFRARPTLAGAAPPVRAAYFYSYMDTSHVDSLAAHGISRAIVKFNADSLDARGRAELARLGRRAAVLGMELAPDWLFQSPPRLAARPGGRRYTWGRNVVESEAPCPLDSAYWQSALIDRAEEFLSAAPSLKRVAVDLELYHGGRPHYDAGPCRCAFCLKEYAAGTPGLEGRDPSRLSGLLGYEEARVAGILRPMLEAFARRHPGVRLEVLDLDLDSFVHRALGRALARTGIPTTDYTERSYTAGAATLPAARQRLRAIGLGSAPLVGGLWLKRFTPTALVPAMRAVEAGADGWFIFTTYSLWLDPQKLTGPYTLLGSPSDYWSALARASAAP